MTPRNDYQMEMRLAPDEIIVDSFAGGGGASLGISWALGRGPHVAINHDQEAITLHAANHPDSEHYPEDVWQVDPVEACRGRKVGLMWLSPDCKHFSKAKGGKPVSKKIRGLAWTAVRWAKAVRPRVIVLENVEEFQTWGPVDRETNRPCPERKGQTFRSFVRRLTRLGYEVQWRELRACDYGAPTIRKRLFLIARCDGQPIVWPVPTHGKNRAQPWRTAAECIDWSIPCPSIFERKKALADNTLRRIARGIDRYVLNNPRPFIVGLGGRQGQSPERPIDKPYQTITAKADSAIVAPTLVQTGYGERAGQAPRSLDITSPLGTVVGGGVKHALVSAFLAKHYSERKAGEIMASSLHDPAPTVTTIDHNALVASSLVHLRGTDDTHLHGNSLDEPMRTISAGGFHAAEVRAFLCAYYGNEKDGGALTDPMRTVTSKERFGLVTVEGIEYAISDIGMRMLAPRELYRAQGFPDSYRIDVEYRGKPMTKTAQVRMCGNSVCPPLAAAIVRANLFSQTFAPALPEIAA